MKENNRECGECSLCCKLLKIKTFNKPANSWCHNFQLGIGCLIYSLKPKECNDFKCIWLIGLTRTEDIPSKTGIMIFMKENIVYFIEDAKAKNKAIEKYSILMLRLCAIGYKIVVDCNGIRQYYG